VIVRDRVPFCCVEGNTIGVSAPGAAKVDVGSDELVDRELEAEMSVGMSG